MGVGGRGCSNDQHVQNVDSYMENTHKNNILWSTDAFSYPCPFQNCEFWSLISETFESASVKCKMAS